MATKTAKKASKSNGQPATLELAVAFGNVNVGDETARLGISLSRANLTVAHADRSLCGKRLTVKLLARPMGASAEQPSLSPDMDDDTVLEGVADVGGFNASPKKISAGLTFLLSTIDVSEIAKFAKREGMLTVYGIEDIPENESADEE